MKKTLALIIALLMVVTCFVACGKEEEDSGNNNQQPVVSTPNANNSNASGAGSSSAAESTPVESKPVQDTSVEEPASQENSVMTETASIVGAWSGVIMDYAELIVASMEGVVGDDFVYTPVEVVATYNFKADGNVECSVNVDEVKTALNTFMDELATYLAAAQGSSKDEMLATLKDQMDVDAAVEELKDAPSGTYTVVGDALTITYEMDGETVEEEGTISASQIVINSDGVEMTLTKK